jgi:hypothetical protein
MFEQLTVIILLARVRRMMTRTRRMTPFKHLAGAAALGGPSHILPLLGSLLTARIHPEIRYEGKINRVALIRSNKR